MLLGQAVCIKHSGLSVLSLCMSDADCKFTLQHNKVVSLSTPFLPSPNILFAFQTTAECRNPVLRLFNTVVGFHSPKKLPETHCKTEMPLNLWLSSNAARHSCIFRAKDDLAAQQWLLTQRALKILAKKDPFLGRQH